MTVVSDSSPLHYLILIDALPVLPALFGALQIPTAVAEELLHPAAPALVRSVLRDPPAWLTVERVPVGLDFEGAKTLGAGEREAITLAGAYGADALLLIDESRGREAATEMGVRFMGTLGVLDRAAATGLVDLPSILQRLLATTFYVNPRLLRSLLDADAARKKG